MSYQIRRMTFQDIDEVVRLENDLLGETLGKEMLEEELNRQILTLLVALDNDKIIGYLSSYFLDGEGEIYNFVVDRSYQRQGIGTLLLNETIRMNKVKTILLEVKESNLQAINFYLKNDFHQISIRKNYYNGKENALVFRRTIC